MSVMRNPESDTGDTSDGEYITGEIVPRAALRSEGTVSVQETLLRDRIAAAWLAAQRSENTRKAYGRDIRTFFAYCDRWTIDALQAMQVHLDGYRMHLESPEAGELSDASQARKLSAVSSFYRYALREFESYVRANPLTNLARPSADEWATSAWLERDEAERVLTQADKTGLWEAALLRVMVYTGVRVSELCNARASDLGTERGVVTLVVRRKGGKRVPIAIPADAAEAMNRYLDGRRSGPLFYGRRGGQLTRDEVTYRLGLLVRAAGITDKKITPHSLRHTAATMARESGRDVRGVQQLLGHKRIETTLRYEHALQGLEDSAAHDVARYVRGEA